MQSKMNYHKKLHYTLYFLFNRDDKFVTNFYNEYK
jgi:hypothetical protein